MATTKDDISVEQFDAADIERWFGADAQLTPDELARKSDYHTALAQGRDWEIREPNGRGTLGFAATRASAAEVIAFAETED